MGRYDNVKDNDNVTTIALWKPEDCEEFKDIIFINFEEAGDDANPQLSCEDDSGAKYIIYGAWHRNMLDMVRTFGVSTSNWTAGRLAMSKKGRHLILTPVHLVKPEIRLL